MNEEEKKVINIFIEKCNKYDESVEIKGISVGEEYRMLDTVCKALNLIEKLQKENEELKNKLLDTLEGQKVIKEETPQYIKENYIPKPKVKDKIEEEIKYHEKNILDIENITMLKSKTAKEEAEIEFNKYAIVVLNKILQELIEESE